jgi:serine phosphatase RsbU (regulator of sigma subunit)
MLTRLVPLSPRAARLWIALLASSAFALALSYAIETGSSSTDENVFTTPPSAAYLVERLPAQPGTPGHPDLAPTPVEAFVPGDIIVGIDGDAVKTVDDVRRRAAAAGPSAQLSVRARRTTAGAFVTGLVDARALASVGLRDVARGALVIDVTAGGASDRAGMLVGDVIVRIAGHEFKTIFEADARMRSGGAGRAYTYDVVRAGRDVSLHVTLARFGLQIAVLLALLTGLVLIAFGAWIGLMRPQFLGARWLAYGYIPMGFALAVFLGATNRPGAQSLAQTVRVFGLILGLLFGLAGLFWSKAHFPVAWPRLQRARWVAWVLYGLGAAGFVGIIAGLNNLGLALAIAAVTLFAGVVQLAWRRSRPAEYVQMSRSRRVFDVAGLVAALSVFLVPLLSGASPNALAWAFPCLLFLPISTTYIIAKYRLFDLDLRVRRNVQYSLLSLGWGAATAAVLVGLLWTLPRVSLPMPSVRMTSSSIEFDDGAADIASRAALEKALLMVVAILAAFALREAGLRGQRWIAARFDRGDYDYRRASQLLGEVMATRLDLEGLAAGVVETLTSLMPVKRTAVFFSHNARVHWKRSPDGFDPDAWDAFCAASTPDLLDELRATRRSLRTEYASPRLRRALEGLQIEVVYPIRANDALVGALLVGEKRSESAFHASDFEFLAAIGQQVAPAVENAFLYEDLRGQERLRHELQIARQIQMQSLPQEIPHITGLDIAGSSVPALEVGGDYFDYLNGRPDHFTVMVGDVSGKGTSAALYMSKLQGIVRSLHGFGLGPTELFVRTNLLLGRDMERRSFVTAIGGFFETRRCELVIARAGHLPLFHYAQATGRIERILPRGLGFGLSTRPLFEHELEEHRRSYAPGDVFLFVTDGITECQDADGDLFGEERLEALLIATATAGASAEQIRDRITRAVYEFSANPDEPFDDQTVVVVRAVAS